MNNRIRETRKLRNITQEALGKAVGISKQAISQFEKGQSTPTDETLEGIASALSVPYEYLTCETSDPDGWDLWEKNTGYSRSLIEQEIARMKAAHHITGDPDNLQNLIGQAVSNFEGIGATDKGALHRVDRAFTDLITIIDKNYKDPRKEAAYQQAHDGLMGHVLSADNHWGDDFVYDDMSLEVYHDLQDIVQRARREARNLANKYKLG